MKTFCTFVHVTSKIMAGISAGLCLALVFLTTEQVLARYVFSNSSIALQELQWHFFAMIFLLAAPYAVHQNKHVRVDAFSQKFSPQLKRLIETVGILVFVLPSMGLLIYFGWEFMIQARSFSSGNEEGIWQWFLKGERSANPDGLSARWILKSLIPISATVMSLEFITNLVELWKTGGHHD